MRYFVEYTGPRGSQLFLAAGGGSTRDATAARMFESQADAVGAFRGLPGYMKHRDLAGCKVRTRRVAG